MVSYRPIEEQGAGFLRKALGAPGKRILDLGCRSGAVAQHFVESDDVVGIDVDRVALEAAAELGIETVLADVEETLPFPTGASTPSSPESSSSTFVFRRAWSRCASTSPARRGVHRVGSEHVQPAQPLAFLRGQRPDPDPTHLHMLSPDAVSELLEPFDDVQMEFFGGRFIRLHRRLLSWDIAFRGLRRA